MKPKSIIQPIFDRRNAAADARIAFIEGRRYVKRPTFYRHTETGQEFFAIVGSIAFPQARMPGFGVIVGVLKEPDHEKAPRLLVLEEVEEIEEPDLSALLASCEQLRHKWAYPHQLDLWIGDAEHFLQAIAEFNDDLELQGPGPREGIYLSPPSDFEETRRDGLFLQTVRQLLSPAAQGGKRLLIGDSPKLRAHLQNVAPDLKKVEEIPALAALSYACHTLLSTTPWLQFTQPERFEPTIRADGYARESLLSWEDASWEDPEDDDGADDVLLETVKGWDRKA
jgi:hypothetical protein